MRTILVYCDEGVGLPSFKQTIAALKEVLNPSSFHVKSIDRQALLQECWEEQASLFVLPGGRDVPYHEALKGEANAKIAAFVAQGGAYLGLCAGAYYGAKAIEFEKGYPLEICGARELGFFPGKAVGPAYGSQLFCYQSEKGARAAPIDWVGFDPLMLYYNGGCYFEEAEAHPFVTVIARYADINKAAVIECKVGQGKALLSGVHPEYAANRFNSTDPYLKALVPLLQSKEEARKRFWKALVCNTLGLTLNY